MARVNMVLIGLAALVMAGAVQGRAGEPPAPVSMRTLKTTAVVDATPEKVWDAFTTKEGVESWMVPLAEVDFRMGGTIKTNYNKAAGIGGPGTIVHHVLAYVPYRMIAMRFDAPETAGDKKLAEACWWVVDFDEVDGGKTRVTESMVGWGEGPEWDKVYAFFEKGNEWTMQQLVKRFAPAAAGGAPMGEGDALSTLGRLVGGEWIYEGKRPDGGLFRARHALEYAPDGASIVGKGWLGDQDGMFHHGCLQVWRDPAGGTVRFQNIDEGGGIARGTVTPEGDRTVVWDWQVTAPGGKKSSYGVKMVLEDQDHYRFLLSQRAVDGEKALVNILYSRVAIAPEAFTKIKAKATIEPQPAGNR